MTQRPSKDVLRSSAAQAMNFHLEDVDHLTDDSDANAILRNMFHTKEINVPLIRELDSEKRVDVIANLAAVIDSLHSCLSFIREEFPELQDARNKQ